MLELAVALALSAAAPGPSLYVDALRGDDSHTGTLEQPFKTLARASRANNAPVGALYLHCASTWRESLQLTPQLLAPGARLAGYGPDCDTRKATLSGADDFSGGWTRQGDLWSRRVPTTTPKISALFIDGMALHTAQWPNSRADQTQWALVAYGAAPSNQTLTPKLEDLGTLRSFSLEGASVQVRSLPWLIETRKLLALDAVRLVLKLDQALRYEAQPGAGYVLQDKQWMLDAPGEFFHDPTAGRLFVFPRTAAQQIDLNASTVEGSVRDTPLQVSELQGLLVQDIAVVKGRLDGMAVVNAPGTALDRVASNEHGGAGVFMAQWTPVLAPLAASSASPRISRSLMHGNTLTAVNAKHVDGLQLLHNRITNTGLQNGVGPRLAAVQAGPGAVVEGNDIDGTAYVGINFSHLGGSRVAHNRITRYCLRLSDCAAIYAWHGPQKTPTTSTNTLPARSTVEHNLVLQARVNAEGTGGGGSDVLAGVYLDDFVSGVTVSHNTLFGMPQGIFLHNASGNLLQNNEIWLTSEAAMWMSTDAVAGDQGRNNRVVDNHIVLATVAQGAWPAVPRVQAPHALRLWHQGADGGAALREGSSLFTGNRVRQLTGASHRHAWLLGPGVDQQLQASQWLALNGNDWAVNQQALFTPYALDLGPEQVQADPLGSAPTSWKSWFGSAAGSAQTTLPGTAGKPCTPPCARLNASGPGDLLHSPTFVLKPGALYRYAYNAAFDRAAELGAPYISRATTPWDPMADAQGFVSTSPLLAQAGEQLAFEALFRAKDRAPARVNLQLAGAGMSAVFSAVSVREVLAYTLGQPMDWARVVAAPRHSAQLVGCADLGWPAHCAVMDTAGTPISLPSELAAGTTRLFLRADSALRP
jgi:parallel beta-helix repeat protein